MVGWASPQGLSGKELADTRNSAVSAPVARVDLRHDVWVVQCSRSFGKFVDRDLDLPPFHVWPRTRRIPYGSDGGPMRSGIRKLAVVEHTGGVHHGTGIDEASLQRC